MLHLRIVFAFLLLAVVSPSWAQEPSACGKPEIKRVTEIKAGLAALFKKQAIGHIAAVIRNSEVGLANGRNVLDFETRGIMEREYLEEYTKNLDVRAEVYLKDIALGTTGGVNDRCFFKITISGVFDVEDSKAEIPFNLLIHPEHHVDAATKLATAIGELGKKVSASISRNLQK